ncbi:hypothetical protein RJ639_008463 [Escallonia herrerae]|uniref:Uncharacterized protein n=1 Tax=Escallonia herrerae TaxID=1293975 RepID=A0AA88VT22_9ASTE|nr:hypothetical protein RJ639_008463 [Escallonia herrerae]
MAANQASNHETEATQHKLLHNSISLIFKACSDKPQTSNASIFRVPQILRRLNEDAYTPHVVSIGPYHKHDQRLKDMEDHQKSYMHSFLSRISAIHNQLAEDATKKIANIMLEKVADARSCYAATHELDDDVRSVLSQPRCDDPILGNPVMLYVVKHDLLLLENQIPMFVLQTLFDFSLVQGYTLPDLIIIFFRDILNFELEIEKVVRTKSAAHILGLLHDCYRPCDTEASEGLSTSDVTKHSATDLVRAGVRFREDKEREQICMSRTSFEIPKLYIYDSTESMLRNLIAWEQFSPSMSKTITSYAFLMDTLVNTNDDVEVLEKAGVLQNHLGASEDAARLFNSLCKEVFVGQFIFSKEWHEVEIRNMHICNASKHFQTHLAYLHSKPLAWKLELWLAKGSPGQCYEVLFSENMKATDIQRKLSGVPKTSLGQSHSSRNHHYKIKHNPSGTGKESSLAPTWNRDIAQRFNRVR